MQRKKTALLLGVMLTIALFSVPFFPQPAQGISAAPTVNELQDLVGTPNPKIEIPGVEFGEVIIEEEQGKRFLYIPFLGNYISSVYRYAAVAAAVLSVIVIIVAGIIWMTSAGSSDRITKAKKLIGNALIGLALVLGSYTILYAINPEFVQFKSLRVEYIDPKPLPIETLLTEDFGGDPSFDPSFLLEASDIADTGFRKIMMQDSCGDKNGFALATFERRQERLKDIVEAWKRIGVDQGAGIYIRGGSPGCSWYGTDAGWVINVMANLYKKDPSALNLSGVCLSAVQQASTLPYKQRAALGRPLKAQCAAKGKQWNTEYGRLATERAKAAGLFCGDCASTMRSMLFRCFQDSSGGQYRSNVDTRFNPYRPARNTDTCKPRGSVDNSRYTFKLDHPSADEISKHIDKLNFGDIIAWQRGGVGHILMYTGGMGLDFEILEMGGGGRGDVSGAGGDKAQQLAKIPWKISGMRAHKSAEVYLREIAAKKDKCIFAWSPIKN